MRRSLALVLAWLVAVAVALAVAWQGVAIVANQVTDDRPGPLSVAEVQEARDEGSGEMTPPDQPEVVDPPRSTSTTPSDGPREVRTYNLTGGSVALQFEPSGVTVVWANPNPGFGVESEPEGPGIKVEFESDGHRSRIDAWWDDGPRFEEREDPR